MDGDAAYAVLAIEACRIVSLLLVDAALRNDPVATGTGLAARE